MSGTETPSNENVQESGWRADESDEANYNFSDEKGVWQPKPEDILAMFEKLAKGGPLPLKWTCPGRRPPSKDVKLDDSIEERMDVDEEDSKEAESKVPETSAFDFDEPQVDFNAKLTPRRAPGGSGRTPRTVKIACMENVMKTLKKQQQSEREARRVKGSPSTGTAGGRGRLLNFGTPNAKSGSTGATLPSMSPASDVSAVSKSGTAIATTPLPSLMSSKIMSPLTPKVSSENNVSTANGASLAQSSVHTSKAPDMTANPPVSTVIVTVTSKADTLMQSSPDTSKVSNQPNIIRTLPEISVGTSSHASNVSQSVADSTATTTESSSDLERSTPSSAGLDQKTLGTVISSMTNNLITTQTIPNPVPTTENVSLDEEFGLNKNTLPAVPVTDQPTTSKASAGAENVVMTSTATDAQNITSSSTASTSSPVLPQVFTASATDTAVDSKVKPTSPSTDTSNPDQPSAVSEAVPLTSSDPVASGNNVQTSSTDVVPVSETAVASTDEQEK